MENLVQHVKKVAADDVRLYFAPFVAIYKFLKREVQAAAAR